VIQWFFQLLFSSNFEGLGVYGEKIISRVVCFTGHSPPCIGFLALPGKQSSQPIRDSSIPPISAKEPDSFVKDDVYVIRRSCQTFPCFLVHYNGIRYHDRPGRLRALFDRIVSRKPPRWHFGG
jgi:hypothetical protein